MYIKNKKHLEQFNKRNDIVKRIIENKTIENQEVYRLFNKNKEYEETIKELKEVFIESYKKSKKSAETIKLLNRLNKFYNMVNDNNNTIVREYYSTFKPDGYQETKKLNEWELYKRYMKIQAYGGVCDTYGGEY